MVYGVLGFGNTACVRVHGAEEVRCYCNDAACVTTAYICKSQVGLCFSQSTPDVATAVSHGCAESLSAHLLGTCSESQVAEQQHQQVIRCCSEDLCNYVTSGTGWLKLCMTTNFCRYESVTGLLMMII